MPRPLTKLVLLALFPAAACTNASSPAELTDSGPDESVEVGRTLQWNFDDDDDGAQPSGFTSSLGQWLVEDDDSAPSPGRALVQSGNYADREFPRVVVDRHVFDDVRLAVSCIAREGEVDQVCGLMFHLVDSDNYFITRANALEDNLRVYHVVDGKRQEFANVDLDITFDDWHRLQVETAGTAITVSWDDEVVLTTDDDTFTRGHIGLWTKADSVTAYDDLEATAL